MINVRPESNGHTEGKAVAEKEDRGLTARAGKLRASYLRSLSLNDKINNNRLGGEERKYLRQRSVLGLKGWC